MSFSAPVRGKSVNSSPSSGRDSLEPAPLAINGLNKNFLFQKEKQEALDDVGFTIKAQAVTGLIGPDGAGKTTLMRLCAGLLVPDSGHIRIFGHETAAEAIDDLLGYMPQRFGLYVDLSVQENLDLYADLQGVAASQRPRRYRELLAMAGLEPFADRLAGRLSGGMKQKLGLVCTLVKPPQLLLLDEPTVGVDPVSRRELWDIVYHLVEQEGMSVLLSTAYLDEAERCDEVLLLYQGKIIGQDRPAGFSKKVEGRVWQVQAPALHKRDLLRSLADDPAVLDATISGSAVRVITHNKEWPEHDHPRDDSFAVSPLTPHFEDYFIATLKTDTTVSEKENSIVLSQKSSTNNDDNVIVAKNLMRRFGDFTAVDKISFKVRSGEIFGLLGANGAGKTTTFRMLCGLLPITSGSCTVAGLDLRKASAKARGKIGYMAQRFSLYGNLSVLQNLRFFASAYGLRGKLRKKRIEWVLDTFGLQSFAEHESMHLPLGYKQRLALSASLMHEPEVLFLDEPTSGVDPLARREFWTRINSLADQGVTVLVTTHFMEEAEYCDRMVIMAEGKLLAEGTPEHIRQGADPTGTGNISMEDAFIELLESNNRRSEEVQ